MERMTALDDHAVVGGFHMSAHGFQIGNNSVDAVGFFDFQLLSILDDGRSFCEAGKNSQHRNLIDESRNQISANNSGL